MMPLFNKWNPKLLKLDTLKFEIDCQFTIYLKFILSPKITMADICIAFRMTTKN